LSKMVRGPLHSYLSNDSTDSTEKDWISKRVGLASCSVSSWNIQSKRPVHESFLGLDTNASSSSVKQCHRRGAFVPSHRQSQIAADTNVSSFLSFFGPPTDGRTAGMLVPRYDGDFRYGPPGVAALEELYQDKQEFYDNQPSNGQGGMGMPMAPISCQEQPEGYIENLRKGTGVGDALNPIGAAAAQRGGHCYWGNSHLTPGDFPGLAKPPPRNTPMPNEREPGVVNGPSGSGGRREKGGAYVMHGGPESIRAEQEADQPTKGAMIRKQEEAEDDEIMREAGWDPEAEEAARITERPADESGAPELETEPKDPTANKVVQSEGPI